MGSETKTPVFIRFRWYMILRDEEGGKETSLRETPSKLNWAANAEGELNVNLEVRSGSQI